MRWGAMGRKGRRDYSVQRGKRRRGGRGYKGAQECSPGLTYKKMQT